MWKLSPDATKDATDVRRTPHFLSLGCEPPFFLFLVWCYDDVTEVSRLDGDILLNKMNIERLLSFGGIRASHVTFVHCNCKRRECVLRGYMGASTGTPEDKGISESAAFPSP